MVATRHRARTAGQRRWFGLAVGLAILALAAVGLLVLRWPGSDAGIRADLINEFSGAYPHAAIATGDLVEINLVAAPSTTEVLDGVLTDVWAYNNAVPGPALRVSLGDSLRVQLRNDLPVETTIHWHGVRVPNNMDGVPGLNQPPIPPGGEFAYEFTPPDPGTFWYHSHTDGAEQLDRGLYGSLVVEDPVTLGYTQDVVWVVDDWLLTEAGQVDPNFNSASEVEHNGRWGDVVGVNASTSEVLLARPGERLRIRMVNASNGRVYAPRFGGLQAEVIAVDGLFLRGPQPADLLQLAPGNRIDFDVVLPADPGVFPITDDFTGDVFTLATIVVEGEPVITPTFPAPTNPNVPTWAQAERVEVDREYRLDIRRADGKTEWTMNQRAFPDIETFDINQGEFTKIRMTNDSQLLHPMHLHGQFFKVLARDGEPIDEGHFQDTVLVFPGQQIEIGLVALDPGTWLLHCHIQEHAEAGMMTTLTVIP